VQINEDYFPKRVTAGASTWSQTGAPSPARNVCSQRYRIDPNIRNHFPNLIFLSSRYGCEGGVYAFLGGPTVKYLLTEPKRWVASYGRSANDNGLEDEALDPTIAYFRLARARSSVGLDAFA
jgi:hypothetical protein